MKIGLLLGSFDPIHIGHINIASCVLNSGLCDKVLFVVAKHNPWKDNEPAPMELRCAMIKASIRGFDGRCEVCDLEKDIEPPTYSYKVLDKIREVYPTDEIIIIGGSDTIQAIPQWKNFETHIKNKVSYIEVKRNDGAEICNKIPFKKHLTSRSDLGDRQFWYIKTQRIDASSTLVRNMVKKGRNPIPYINEEVLKIITDNNLYKDGTKKEV